MAADSTALRYIRSRDWRIWFGIAVTLGWIGGGLWYVIAVGRSTPGQALTLDVIGSFLEGAFAPLAFLWLVIGLFIQQRELANNTEALRKTSEYAERQAQTIAATEMNARQETFFKIKENVDRQLGGISGMLYASSKGPNGDGELTREQMDACFKHLADGDHEIFARMFLTLGLIDDGDLEEMFYGTAIRARHTQNYVHTFERLCRLARNCDVDGIIEDALMQSALGLLYRRIMKSAPVPPETTAG